MPDIKIIEFKAHCADHAPLRAILVEKEARYLGEDHQIDTYFKVPAGRLKLREGSIERKLIFYSRANQAGPKRSDVLLFPVEKPFSAALRKLLSRALGVLAVVDKRRHIYFIDNVKIHLDEVEGLGQFVEVEAIGQDGSRTEAFLAEQCDQLKASFAVADQDLIALSYSDMMMAKE